MSGLLYGLGFVLVYEAIYICNKAYVGSRLDRPKKLGLFYATYGASIVAFVAIIIYGFFYFHWWLPVGMLGVIAPLGSLLIMRWFRSALFLVIQAILFLVLGCTAAFYAPFTG